MTETREMNPRSRDNDGNPTRKRPVLVYSLWATQVLLAALFLFAGGAKLVMPADAMKGGPIELPVLFLRLLGVAEVLGALGLILPGLLRIKPGLTPLAALGLMIIMIGATVLNFLSLGAGLASFTLVVGCLAGFVAYARWRLAPHKARSDSNKNDYAFRSISSES
jgi:DoxX-like protein